LRSKYYQNRAEKRPHTRAVTQGKSYTSP